MTEKKIGEKKMNGFFLPLCFSVNNIPVNKFRFRQQYCAPFLIGSGIPLSVSLAGSAHEEASYV